MVRHDLSCGIQRQSPVLLRISVRRQRRADAVAFERCNLVSAEHVFERHEAAGFDGLADMRVIEDDKIVAGAEIGDRVGLEAFERLLVPMDGEALPRRDLGSGIAQGVVAARVVPGEGLVAGHCERTAPPARSFSMAASS